MALDVHAHLYPPEYLAFLRQRGGASSRLADRLAHTIERNRFFGGALDERLAMLDRVGIERQVLSLPNQWVQVEDPAATAEHARAANDTLAAVCARYPDRFRLFASLPLHAPEPALRELERAVADLGAVGIIAPTHVLGRPLDEAHLAPLYAELEARGLPLFLHPGPPPYAIAPEGLPRFGLDSTLFFPVEDANALLRLALSGTLERFPRLRVICPHLGGAVPFLWRRIDHLSSGQMPDGGPPPRPATDYLRRVLYDTVSMHPPAVRCACDTFGADHLVLGTDFPYVDEAGIRDILASVDALGLGAAERAAVLEDTARGWIAW